MKAKEQYKNLIEYCKKCLSRRKTIFILTVEDENQYEIVNGYKYFKQQQGNLICRELNDLLTKLKEGKIIVVEELIEKLKVDKELQVFQINICKKMSFGTTYHQGMIDYIDGLIFKLKELTNK